MPFGLGHIWFALTAWIFYGGIFVVIVLVIRAIVQSAQRLARCADSLEAIQKTLLELKSDVEALQQRPGREP